MPATEQLNIRVTAELKARFRARAKREGMSQAELLEALLTQRGALPAPALPAPVREDPKPQPDDERPAIDFAVWLSNKTGVPRALTARAIAAGRVLVAGVPYTAAQIGPHLLAHGVVYEDTSV